MTQGQRRRRLRGEAFARRRRQSFQQLVLAMLALAMLFFLWHQLATGAAGCFTFMAKGGQVDAAAAVDHDAATADAPGSGGHVVAPKRMLPDTGRINRIR